MSQIFLVDTNYRPLALIHPARANSRHQPQILSTHTQKGRTQLCNINLTPFFLSLLAFWQV
jgi:hypothetical protein